MHLTFSTTEGIELETLRFRVQRLAIELSGNASIVVWYF